jgi:hypothetical protein
MFVGIQHRIRDAEAMLSRSEKMAENAPPGMQARQFCLSKDRAAATCIWEADSVEAVRDYVDRTQGDSSENTYFEVDAEASVGLPEPATARA